jgi:coenzyme F420-0:L-glutamate ligase/coenzyme F420-1:gamma-L-glutamate ligase
MELFALQGIPLVAPGDDLAGLIIDGYGATGQSPENGDVIVIAQKIVSKAEGRHADLRDVTPSARARELAGECDKDPRLVEPTTSAYCCCRSIRTAPAISCVKSWQPVPAHAWR